MASLVEDGVFPLQMILEPLLLSRHSSFSCGVSHPGQCFQGFHWMVLRGGEKGLEGSWISDLNPHRALFPLHLLDSGERPGGKIRAQPEQGRCLGHCQEGKGIAWRPH